jgi:hypothetical protein
MNICPLFLTQIQKVLFSSFRETDIKLFSVRRKKDPEKTTAFVGREK